MTDLSDGIASAIAKAKDDFNIGFRIVQNEIGLDRNVSRAILLSGASDLDLSLYFGGDYERTQQTNRLSRHRSYVA